LKFTFDDNWVDIPSDWMYRIYMETAPETIRLTYKKYSKIKEDLVKDDWSISDYKIAFALKLIPDNYWKACTIDETNIFKSQILWKANKDIVSWNKVSYIETNYVPYYNNYSMTWVSWTDYIKNSNNIDIWDIEIFDDCFCKIMKKTWNNDWITTVDWITIHTQQQGNHIYKLSRWQILSWTISSNDSDYSTCEAFIYLINT